MRLAGREWRTLVGTARLDGHVYRVVRPARPMAHASLYESPHGAQLTVDRSAAADLAAAWWLATRSPRSLVHLPLRSSTSSCGGQCGDRKLDLVLLHHSLGFPLSRWKRVRARLSHPRPHKVTLPPRPFRALDDEEYRRQSHHGFRDHLRWGIAADTLFLVGSRLAYEFEGDRLRELAEETPTGLAALPGRHCCAEIEVGRWSAVPPDRRGPYAQVHVECCDLHW